MIHRVAIRMVESGKLYVGYEKDRHDALYRRFGQDLFVGPHEQGFVDENGIFYTRSEAAHHAFMCGQVDNDYGSLISEDLW